MAKRTYNRLDKEVLKNSGAAATLMATMQGERKMSASLLGTPSLSSVCWVFFWQSSALPLLLPSFACSKLRRIPCPVRFCI